MIHISNKLSLNILFGKGRAAGLSRNQIISIISDKRITRIKNILNIIKNTSD
jgi:hypothetical protein